MRGFIFIAFGVLYFVKPDLFNSGIWKKTSVAARTKSKEEYTSYMKIIAIILIIAGIALLVFDNRQMFQQQHFNVI